MICCFVRHGKDDETIRGGWSQHGLTIEGIQQAEILAGTVAELGIQNIYSSDLPRAVQTAQIMAEKTCLPVALCPQFREVNNGDLAGMKNEIASERYPGVFWNRLGWEENYPNGESPKQFYERICSAWTALSAEIITNDENVLLVTHGGVIQVILSILEGRAYTNNSNQRNIPHATMIIMSYVSGAWGEIC